MSGPLSGMKVLDLSTVLMGPYATQILGDMGADIIKVEPPEGDVLRHNSPTRSPAMSHLFLNAGRNKRSVVLDLKQPPAREACLALAKQADVLVYNIRPQAMARLKLGYEDVREVNPRIIYVGAFGYSQRGPYGAKAAYDDLIQGAAALPWLASKAGGGPPRYVPMAIADRAVGLHIVNAVCAALYFREKSGKGQRIDVPMFESLLQMVLGEHLGGETFLPAEGAPGYSRMLSRERVPYETADGHLCLLVYNDKQWKAFLALIGRPELMADPRFATAAGRARSFDDANALVAAEIRKRSTAEWLVALEAADIPVQRMNSLDEVIADPHLAAIGYFIEREHPTEGRIRSMAPPAEWSESPLSFRRHAPRLGEHTREVLAEAGLTEAEIKKIIHEDT